MSFRYTDEEWKVLTKGYSLAQRDAAVELLRQGKSVETVLNWNKRSTDAVEGLRQLAQAQLDKESAEVGDDQ